MSCITLWKFGIFCGIEEGSERKEGAEKVLFYKSGFFSGEGLFFALGL